MKRAEATGWKRADTARLRNARWGRAIRGWWIDGRHFADEMYRHPAAPDFRSFAKALNALKALKAGNPGAIVAVNRGAEVPVTCHSDYQVYMAGDAIAPAFAEQLAAIGSSISS